MPRVPGFAAALSTTLESPVKPRLRPVIPLRENMKIG
jgi:hypothetical protein